MFTLTKIPDSIEFYLQLRNIKKSMDNMLVDVKISERKLGKEFILNVKIDLIDVEKKLKDEFYWFGCFSGKSMRIKRGVYINKTK